jgi:hypothetical protein
MTQEECDEVVLEVMRLHKERHPYMLEIGPEWDGYLSPQRIHSILDVSLDGIEKQLRSSARVGMSGAMRWGATFHQEVLINTYGALV